MKKLVALLLGLCLFAFPIYGEPSSVNKSTAPAVVLPPLVIGVISIPTPVKKPTEKSLEDVIEEAMKSVVSVEVTHLIYDMWTGDIETGESLGAGFFINDKGHLLTNVHVINSDFVTKGGVHPDPIIKWQVDGATVSAKAEILAIDKKMDVALLKLRDKQDSPTHLEFGSSKDIRIGASLIILGHPLREMWSASTGIVSAKDRKWGDKEDGTKLIQTDAAVNFGNSGGPVLDSEGQVIGMTVGLRTNAWFGTFSGLGYLIPEKDINDFLDKYRI